MDEASPTPPTKINPYKALNLSKKATAAEVKTAYKKLALKNHPDKVAPSHRDTAHTKFQEIAFAYAILSDPTRRSRYDTTGSTSESLSDDFNWSAYFKAQYAETVTVDKLNSIKSTYQGSDEEKHDVLDTYKRRKGDLDKLFRDVMMSNALDDEARFRGYIDAAIIAGEVPAFDAYTKEDKKAKKKRQQKAERESKEAIEHAKDIGVYESLFGDGKPKHGGEQKGLADLIQQRQKQRAATFMDDLEAKYAPKAAANGKSNGKKRKPSDEPGEESLKTNGKGQKRRKAAKVVEESSQESNAHDEPPEEAFQAMGARMEDSRPPKAKYAEQDSDAEESLGDEDSEEEEEEEGVSEEMGVSEEEEEGDEASEEETPKPTKETKNPPINPPPQRNRVKARPGSGRRK